MMYKLDGIWLSPYQVTKCIPRCLVTYIYMTIITHSIPNQHWSASYRLAGKLTPAARVEVQAKTHSVPSR